MGQRIRGSTVRGPLAPWAAGFAQWLVARGYQPSAVRHRLWLLAAMSLWLERRALEPAELTDERALLFVAERRAAGLKTWAADESVRLPFEYLRAVDAVPPADAILENSPVTEILTGYREYLVLERGLAQSTIEHCLREARLFLEQLPEGAR
jgi:integrase/recombinase XerD